MQWINNIPELLGLREVWLLVLIVARGGRREMGWVGGGASSSLAHYAV